MRLPVSFITVAAVGSIASVSAFACIKSPRVASTRVCSLINNSLSNSNKNYHRTALSMSTESPMDFVKSEIASDKVSICAYVLWQIQNKI